MAKLCDRRAIREQPSNFSKEKGVFERWADACQEWRFILQQRALSKISPKTANGLLRWFGVPRAAAGWSSAGAPGGMVASMLTPRQSKAARALLNWTQADLAERSGVKLSARGLPLFGSRRRGLECASKKPFASPNSISCSAKLAKAKCHSCGINSRTWELAR